MKCVVIKLEGVGEHSLPPQNVCLTCKLFCAENNQGPKDSGRNFDFPLNCLMNAEALFQDGSD